MQTASREQVSFQEKHKPEYVDAHPLEACGLELWGEVPCQQAKSQANESPDLSNLLNDLAILYLEQGHYQQAEPLLQRALQIRDQALGSSHPQVAFPLNGLADLYLAQGRYGEAEPLYQRALAIRSQRRGKLHLETADSLHGLARLHERRNQPEQALELFQRALRIREQHLGPQHPDTQETRACYAHLLRLCGRGKEAAALETASS